MATLNLQPRLRIQFGHRVRAYQCLGHPGACRSGGATGERFACFAQKTIGDALALAGVICAGRWPRFRTSSFTLQIAMVRLSSVARQLK
jgi:hypothetical protein